MSDAKITFVILTWNSEKYIENCLRSVLGIGAICNQVCVVDNGSTDNSPQITKAISEEDDRITLFELPENKGTTVSRNIALRHIDPASTHVCILDSDTVVNCGAFQTMLNALDSDKAIGVVGPRMSSSSGDEQLTGRNMPTVSLKLRKSLPFPSVARRAEMEEIPHAPVVGSLQDVGYLLSACWLMPVESLDAVGLFDEKIFYAPEDVEWCSRCHSVGLRVCLCTSAHIIHEYQRISKKKLFSKMNFEHLRGLMYYFSKGYYRL